MRTLFTLICLGMVVGCTAYADDTAHVTVIKDGKPLQLPPAVQHDLVEQSIKLLRNCGYAELCTKDILANAQKEPPYLHFSFPEPRHVVLLVATNLAPSGQIEVELTEMVITLPLSSGTILVPYKQGALYLAKYDCKMATEFENTLRKAQKP